MLIFSAFVGLLRTGDFTSNLSVRGSYMKNRAYFLLVGSRKNNGGHVGLFF